LIVLAYLFVKVPQQGDSKVFQSANFLSLSEDSKHFQSLSQADNCHYQANYSKVEVIPLSELPKSNLPACFPHYLSNAEHQAGK